MALTPYILNISRESGVRDSSRKDVTKTVLTQTPVQSNMYQELLETLRFAKKSIMLNTGESYWYGGSMPSIVPSTFFVELGSATLMPRTSKTNVQVIGVDEPDIVKVDNNLIAVASNSKVYIVDAKEKTVLKSISFNGNVVGLFLHNNKLVIVVQETVNRISVIGDKEMYGGLKIVIPKGSSITSIHVYSLEDPENPIKRLSVNVTGTILGARRINNYIHLVILQPIDYSVIDIESETLVIPTVNGVPLTASYIHKVDEIPSDYANILSIDLEKAEYRVKSFMISRSTRIYMVPERLYIVSSEIPYNVLLNKLLEIMIKIVPMDIASNISRYLNEKDIFGAYQVIINYFTRLKDTEGELVVNMINNELAKIELELTRVYIFSVDGIEIVWKGNLVVPGKVLDQFAIEEYNGIIVLATTKSNTKLRLHIDRSKTIATEAKNHTIIIRTCNRSKCFDKTLPVSIEPWKSVEQVYIYTSFDAEGESENNVYLYNVSTLNVLGKLEGLAKGEIIYSARLVKDILFLVTFRVVDPLFAIDISDPNNPKVLGFLKIPGFSEYLHSLPGDKLLGIGMEANNLKISLFDVKDPTNMSEISRIYIGEGYSYSEVLHDHHAITLDIEYGRIYIPIEISFKYYDYYYYDHVTGILVIEYENNSITPLSMIQHKGARRAVYIDDELFTISHNSIKVYDYWTLAELTEIPLTD